MCAVPAACFANEPDVSKALNGFTVSFPTAADGEIAGYRARGTVLGARFAFVIPDIQPGAAFSFTLNSEELTTQSARATAVLLADLLCLQQNLSGDEPATPDVQSDNVHIWGFQARCGTEPRNPSAGIA